MYIGKKFKNPIYRKKSEKKNYMNKKKVNIDSVLRILSKYFSSKSENTISNIILFFNKNTSLSTNYIFEFFYEALKHENVKAVLSNDDIESTISVENGFIIFKSYNKKINKNIESQTFKRPLKEFLSVDINNKKLHFYFKNYDEKNRINVDLSTNFYNAFKNMKSNEYDNRIYNYISNYLYIKKKSLIKF
tara:strand:- start:7569 stop:8138 length:570 start_codon:yes stop_codon:yes gene_type:complete